MSKAIKQILARKSQRSMQYAKIPDKDLEQIIDIMNSAPTSSNKFDASALIITDQELKEEMYTRINNKSQEHYKTSGAIIVFLADMNRGVIAAKQSQTNLEFNSLDNLLNSWGDVFIMSQNAVIASTLLGYGTVYLGGIRHFDFPWLLRKRCKLPNNVFPVIAIAIGKIKEEAPQRPRLNRVYHDVYDLQKVEKEVLSFNEEEKQYWQKFNKNLDWMSVAAKNYSIDLTPIYYEYIKNIYDPEKEYKDKMQALAEKNLGNTLK